MTDGDVRFNDGAQVIRGYQFLVRKMEPRENGAFDTLEHVAAKRSKLDESNRTGRRELLYGNWVSSSALAGFLP